MLGALAIGETSIEGLLEGADVIATGEAMRAFGASVTRLDVGSWRVKGVGVGGLLEPEGVIDYGNAGTGVRLSLNECSRRSAKRQQSPGRGVSHEIFQTHQCSHGRGSLHASREIQG